jgi:Archaeal glycosylation protein B long peripheral domain
VVVTGFGTYIDEAAFWEVDGVFSRDEAALIELMDRRDLGYLVAGPFVFGSAAQRTRAFPFMGGELGHEFFERFPLAPLLIAGSGVPESGVHHLEHLLPVYATRKLVPGLSFHLPLIWSYELVPGARMVGTASPRARVEGRLVFHAWGRPYVWRAWTDADASGRWEMRLPLPSGYAASVVTSDSRWNVRAGHASSVSIAVPEEAVRRGRTVRVGALPTNGS